MDSIPFSASPRFCRGVFFFVYICLFCCAFVGGDFSTALAADQVTLSWGANHPDENVQGYRLYVSATSRFDDHGLVKSGFSYAYYFDFTDSQRCLLTDSGPVCEAYTADEVDCEELYGERPRCTLYNLEGQYYFAITAYNTQAESGYTDELSGYYRHSGEPLVSPQVIAMLQQVYFLLLK